MILTLLLACGVAPPEAPTAEPTQATQAPPRAPGGGPTPGPHAGGPQAGGPQAGGPQAGGPQAGGHDAPPAEMFRGPDPSDKVMFRARSADGLRWERLPEPLAPAASSPNLSLIGGEPVVIFVEHGEHLARVPLEGGAPERLQLSGLEAQGLDPEGLIVDPHVSALGGARYRLYFIYQPRELDPGARLRNEVRSALSSDDGDTWVVEPGVRVSGGAVDPDVVPLPEGGWRMYLTEGAMTVTSAVSQDGLSWTAEPGARFQGGGVTSTLQVDDAWWMYFHTPGGIARASSLDGQRFDAPSDALLRPEGEEWGVESPSVLKLGDTWWMVGSSYARSALDDPDHRPDRREGR
ncbi:MAG: hypothetical protein H6741_05475 [Alphaproteobacteria bacterium]|nr:hypothetical protein [Alphaproteobacteria bacterium]MCB9792157.1 hypothetical protein [Alphaproteobacteria bacterium]